MRDPPAFDLAQAGARRWPVRLILIAVVFALVLPGLLFCGILLQQIATTERNSARHGVEATAQRTADTLDRELANIIAALVALGTSPALDTGDIPAFARQAQAASIALGHPIVLADPTGQQLVNSRLPTAPQLPVMASLDTLARVVATHAPAISGLFTSPGENAPSLAIQVPVQRAGTLRYIVATNVRPALVTEILRQQNLPPGWVAAVTDANDRIFARTIDPDRYVGQPAAETFRRHAVGDHAAWIGTALDGQPVLVAMQRQHLADWRVSVGIPLSTVEAQLQRTIALLAVTGSITLVIACLLAWKLAESVAAPLRRLARLAAAARTGIPIPGVRSSIAEVHAVSTALVHATRALRSRADALAADRAQLAAIIETVPVGLLIAECPGGRIVAGNGQLERMLRQPIHPDTDAVAGDAWLATHPDGRPVLPEERPLTRVLRGEPHAELLCLYHRDDGSDIWLQVVGAPIRANDGAITGGLIAVLDVDEAVRARDEKARFAERLEALVDERTAALQQANQRLRDEMAARTAAEEQLRQAQKMEAVGQLTGGIAHDFNNLLTIVVGSLDLLRRRLPDTPETQRTRRLVDNALDGAARAATLTARLLAFSRRQPLSPQPLDANHLVQGMADLLLRTLGDAIPIQTRLAPALWQIHADPNQLENALLNLAVNARDAMRAAGTGTPELLIATANAVLDPNVHATDPDVQPGEYVALSVTDNGTGMPPEVAARVFEPFYTTKLPGHGTGLGLSQVHGFVKQSGGHVALRTAPGQGTTVTLYLPRVQGADAQARPPAADPAPTPLAPITILVVEDEAAVRRYSAEALRELGHTVLEAADPPAALALLGTRPDIALLFTDVVLPHMNGTQLAAEARRLRPDLPVLLTSGYTGDATQADTLLDPGSLLLHKPFTLAQLADLLHKAVAMRPAGLEPATKPL